MTAHCEKATLFKVDQANPSKEAGTGSPDSVVVQFNPTSLSYSVQNTVEKKGRDAKAKQFVAQTTAKLEFDLTFDSTHDGGDVRRETDRVKQFLNPGDKKTNKDQAPPLVGFRWGSFSFKGIVESFKENLEFFSAEGVPLRSVLKIGLSSQDPADVFETPKFGQADAAAAAGAGAQLVNLPGQGASGLAARGGNPGAGRALAATNGLESMRSGGVAAIGTGVDLKPAASFSSGASFGAAAGGTGAASLQPFAALGPSRTPSVLRLDAASLMPPQPVPPADGAVALGGRGTSLGSTGLTADMGPGARIKFD